MTATTPDLRPGMSTSTRDTPAHRTYRVFTQTVTPYPGHPRTVQFRYSVPGVVQQMPDGRVYRLSVNAQPLFHPASMNITVHLPKGSDVSAAGPGWTVDEPGSIGLE